MSKILVIKDADFSSVAVSQVLINDTIDYVETMQPVYILANNTEVRYDVQSAAGVVYHIPYSGIVYIDATLYGSKCIIILSCQNYTWTNGVLTLSNICNTVVGPTGQHIHFQNLFDMDGGQYLMIFGSDYEILPASEKISVTRN